MQAAGDHEVGNRNGWTRLTAVGIDKDKNSQQAVKWAVDHLLINNQSIILVHVRQKTLNYGFAMAEVTPEATREQIEADNTQLFLPYRGFCARKGVNVTEVVLEDTDVSKALIEYISTQHIHNFVVGVTNRNALTKKFRNPDVSAAMVKNAPDFCAVYVISKGKAVTVRSAKGPVPMNSSPQKKNIDPDDSVKTPFTRASKKGSIPPPPLLPDQMKSASRDRHLPGVKPAAQALTPRDSTDSSRRGLLRASLGSLDFSDDSYYSGMPQSGSDYSICDYSICQDSPLHSGECSGDSSPTGSSKRDLEAEMKRLKLELKQTMDMYSNACKEAITAKQQAKEFHQWKLEEARKFEEARNAGEAALAVAEMEKARCKAAIEAAEVAKKKAEMEEKRRKSAEYKALREAEEKKRALDALAQNDTRYRKYSIDEIELATEYFSKSLKIGEGGYGPVFRACLDHTPVAIKVLRPDASQGRKQFNQEVEVLSCIRHPNMVLLLGACPEYCCLVYEYMDNGSLEDRLMRRGNTPPIPWPTRFKIAAEIATALLFLHQSKPEPLVHRDLKPGNILLDRNYVSKISDVGLARLVPPSIVNQVTQYRMTSTAGTLCYIDPEYQQTGMLGCKSDIYSLGVMLLQIITARPPMGLSHNVERAISKGTFEEMLDPTVKDWPVEECLSYTKIALKCSELCRKDRPDLGTVVLPELNRLRNLGHAYENTVGFSSGGGGTGSGANSFAGSSGEFS